MGRFTKGWIKLHRRVASPDTGDILRKGPAYFTVWACLLIDASRFPLSVSIGGEPEKFPAGTVILGLREYSGRAQVSVKQLRGAMRYLEATQRIVSKKGTRGTAVTICKYGQYQAHDAPAGQTKGTPRARRGHYNGEVEKYKKKTLRETNFSREFEEDFASYPKQTRHHGGYEIYRQEIQSEDDRAGLRRAIRNYTRLVKEEQRSSRYIKSIESFMEDWREHLPAGPSLVAVGTNSDHIDEHIAKKKRELKGGK